MIFRRHSRIFLLILSCLLVFFPILGHDFQFRWDDNWMALNRYTEGGFTWRNVAAIFTEPFQGQYGPLNQLVYTLLYSVFGYRAAAFHAFPLLLHIANACMVFALVRRVLILVNRTDDKTVCTVAFAVALLFAVHPMQVESVAWISASKILFCTFFTLLLLLSWLKFLHAGSLRCYVASFVLFVLSFGCKEQAVSLPVLLLGAVFVPAFRREKSGSLVDRLAPLLPFFLFALMAGMFTMSFQNMATVQSRAGYPLWQRLVFACYSLVEYTVKLAFPANLLYVYPFPMKPGDALPAMYLIYPPVAAAAGIALYCFRRYRVLLAGVAFFIINLVLTLHIIPMSRFAVVADRYVYLASAGLFFIAAWHAVPWLQKMAASGRKWVVAVAACWLLYLGGYAHFRTYTWKDSDTLKKELRELIHINEILKQDFQEQ
jgi:hypothetical protein